MLILYPFKQRLLAENGKQPRVCLDGVRSVGDLGYQLDFDHGAQGQGVDAECGAGVATGIAEDGDQQVGAPVDHHRLARVVVDAVHKSAHADNAFDSAEIAQLGFERGNQGKGRTLSGFDCLGFVHGGTHFSCDDLAVGVSADVAGEKEQVPRTYGGHVIGDRFTDRRKRQFQIGKFFFWSLPGCTLHREPKS